MIANTKIKRLYKKHRNLILYGVIGSSGALLDFVLYALMYKSFDVPPFIASFLSVSLAIANNFLLNNWINFKKSGHILSRFLSFYLTGIGGAILSSLLIVVLYNGIGLDGLVSKLITIPPVVLLQFYINKKVSFSDDPDKIFRTVKKLIKNRD